MTNTTSSNIDHNTVDRAGDRPSRADNAIVVVAGITTGTNTDVTGTPGNATTATVNGSRIYVANGSNVYIGTVSLTNLGLMQVDKGATIEISSSAGSGSNGMNGANGTMTNNGSIVVSGGHLTIDAPWKQGPHGSTLIENQGTLTVNNSADGGTIVIKSGMLQFGRIGFANSQGVQPSLNFRSTLDFAGTSGSIDFGITGLQIAFLQASQELVITAPAASSSKTLLGDIHLSGGHYTAGEFSVQGSYVVFHSVTVH